MKQTPRQECSTPAAFRAHVLPGHPRLCQPWAPPTDPRSAWAPPTDPCSAWAPPDRPTFCLGPPVSPMFCLGPPPSAPRSAWAPPTAPRSAWARPQQPPARPRWEQLSHRSARGPRCPALPSALQALCHLLAFSWKGSPFSASSPPRLASRPRSPRRRTGFQRP